MSSGFFVINNINAGFKFKKPILKRYKYHSNDLLKKSLIDRWLFALDEWNALWVKENGFTCDMNFTAPFFSRFVIYS